MKHIIATIGAAALAMTLVLPGANAQEEAAGAAQEGTVHYPLKHPVEQEWSFAGPFGKYDKAQLQRGLKVYTEVCAACHSLNRVAFRDLADLGYSEEQVKAFAANYEVQDGPNADGEMFTRAGLPTDYFPSPYENPEQAKVANGGAVPPDFSLIAKARGVERGFRLGFLFAFALSFAFAFYSRGRKRENQEFPKHLPVFRFPTAGRPDCRNPFSVGLRSIVARRKSRAASIGLTSLEQRGLSLMA